MRGRNGTREGSNPPRDLAALIIQAADFQPYAEVVMVTRTAERRPLGALGRISLVAALHAGLLLVIANSLGLVPPLAPPVTEATVINEERVDEEPIPQPEPDLTPRRDTVFVPDLEVPPLVFEQDVIIGPPPEYTEVAPPPGGTAVTEALVVGVRQDSRYPLSQPPYPAPEIRAGHTGTADIEVYVLPNGRVGDARIVKSTGFEALDRSALDEARRKWRLSPATRDGVPFAQWHRLRVTFKLNQQR
jgi:periplasmic protein TonB